jgi:hypothetical protein
LEPSEISALNYRAAMRRGAGFGETEASRGVEKAGREPRIRRMA